MKTELLQIRIDAATLTALQEFATNDPELSVSQIVRDAIREKLARDVYGIVNVPTLAAARKNIVQMPQPELPTAPARREGESLVEYTRRKRQESNGAKAA